MGKTTNTTAVSGSGRSVRSPVDLESLTAYLNTLTSDPLDDPAQTALGSSNRKILTAWLQDAKLASSELEQQLARQAELVRKNDPELLYEVEMDAWTAFYGMQDYFDPDYKMDMVLNSALSMLMEEEACAGDRRLVPSKTGLRNWKIIPLDDGVAGVQVRFEKREHGSEQVEIAEHVFEIEEDPSDLAAVKRRFCDDHGMGAGDDSLEYDFMGVYEKPLIFAGLATATDSIDEKVVTEYVNLFLLQQKVETHLSEPGNLAILRGLIAPLKFS